MPWLKRCVIAQRGLFCGAALWLRFELQGSAQGLEPAHVMRRQGAGALCGKATADEICGGFVFRPN